MKRHIAGIFILVGVILMSGCATGPGVRNVERETVFYPAIPAEPRLQFLQSISTEQDIGAKIKTTFDEFLTGQKKTFKSFGRIWDIHSARGKIYVLDRDLRKVVIVDLVNRKFELLQDTRLGKLRNPVGLWVTKDDVKYVADTERQQVIVFDKDNNFLRTYGDKNIFKKPLDVAVFQNLVYVADMDKSQILVLDKISGRQLRTIGEAGVSEGQLHKPTHVVVDQAGNVYVNDAFNFRVQKFDAEGRFVKSYGRLGDTLGSFARPKGIDIDREGYLYVVDAAFENVQIFDEEKAGLLLFFGGGGSSPGSMNLPAGLYIDYDNVEYFNALVDKDFRLKYLVYVSNQLGSRRLNVYGFGEWIGPSLTGEPNTENEPSSEKKQPQ